MAKSKHAFTRYKILHECFSNPVKKFTIDQLVERVNEVLVDHYDLERGVSKRQIYTDIAFMEDSEGYEAPIERVKNGRYTVYQYSDPDYDFASKGLTKKDKMEMQEMAEFIEQFKNLPGFQNYSEMATAMKASILDSADYNAAIQFEVNDFLKGREHLSELYDFIINKKAIEITYRPYNKEPEQLIVSPLFLKQYNLRWFLFVQNHEHNKVSIYALDRIQDFKVSTKQYQETDFSGVDYFDEIIGVTNHKEEEIQKIVLQFSVHRYNYVTTKPLHSSQKPCKEFNGKPIENAVTIDVKFNKELLSTLLSFGSDVKVLQPKSLQEKVKEELLKSIANY